MYGLSESGHDGESACMDDELSHLLLTRALIRFLFLTCRSWRGKT